MLAQENSHDSETIRGAVDSYIGAVAKRNACLKIMGILNRAKKSKKLWAEVGGRLIYQALGHNYAHHGKDVRIDNKHVGYDFWRFELGRTQKLVYAAHVRLLELGC